jgi:hypothetical protein
MKVLLLDAAFAAAPIYNYLVSAGHDVWVMGNRPKDVLAVRAGPNWIEADYSKVDIVASHVKRLQINRVIPGCTDVSMETCLKLNVSPHFYDSMQVNAQLSDKAQFRRLCAELDLPAPTAVNESNFPMQGTFISKPVDAFSGRGITVFDGKDDEALQRASHVAKQASPSGRVVFECFVPGQLYSCSAFVINKQLKDAVYVIEGASANPYAVDTSYVVYDLPKESTQKLEVGLERLCGALQLKDGLLHTQFLLFNGEPFIVEVARRCPGDLYSLLIEYSTGVRYAARYAASFLGESVDVQEAPPRHIVRHTVTSLDRAIYTGLVFNESLSVRAFFPILQLGEPLLPMQGNRAGILFTEVATQEHLQTEYDRFMSRAAYATA